MSKGILRGPIATVDGRRMSKERVRHVILDRDGVLNEEAPDRGYVRSPEEWRWIPGALEGLAMLAGTGIRVSVATNQSGVGRGLMTNDDLDAVHARMLEDAASAGGVISAVFVCPHAPADGCRCRKPSPGLIEAAIEASAIEPAATLLVGDDIRDLQAARAGGVGSVLVLTGKGRQAAATLTAGPVPVYDDLKAVAHWLTETADRAGD